MFCNKCGKEIVENSEFCNFCGNKIILKKQNKKLESVEQVYSETGEDYIWTCDYCGEEFETKLKSDNHEKICNKNPINLKNLCPSCGVENKKEALFCKKCGCKIKSTVINLVNKIDENSGDYKKIKNAGSTAEVLGWFNLIVSPIVAFSSSYETESSLLVFDLIYFLIVSFIFIKYGKKLKKVTGASLKDVTILIWTSVVVIALNILSALGEGGSFSGILFFFELYYLFQARKVLKSLDSVNNP